MLVYKSCIILACDCDSHGFIEVKMFSGGWIERTYKQEAYEDRAEMDEGETEA